MVAASATPESIRAESRGLQKFADTPNVIGDSRFHRGRHA